MSISTVEEDPGASQGRVAAPDPPNLKGTPFARSDWRVDLDLKELDRFHTTNKDDA